MDGYTKSTFWQRLDEEVSPATDKIATIQEMCFLSGPFGDISTMVELKLRSV
jgi:hypothetical protein